MLFKNKKILTLFLISMLFTIVTSSCINSIFSANNQKKNINNINIKQSQTVNYTVDFSFPNIFWFECQIEITFYTNQSGTINVVIDDVGATNNFNTMTQSLNLTENSTQTFIVKIQPKLLTFPGQYQFSIDINGLFTFNQSFGSILGLGYITGVLLFGLFCIPLIYIIIRKPKSKDNISSTTETKSLEKQYEKIEGLPSKKIMCSSCQEIIPEGLSICPECGERIPEFLRYSNPSN
ncbi:MAG: hypothetical protein KGD63_11480 [Candidatus Lokiarchaeota archaeon]|nr:hypothetical protein [Candidatus Lokiarchaeota archaeon]